MPSAQSRLEIAADLSELDRLKEWIDGTLASADVPEEMVQGIQLATEELFTNVATHAYPADRQGPAILSLEARGREVTLVVEDEGPPFDPLREATEPDMAAELDDRPIGGLGIHLVKELSERQAYERAGDRNRLTVVFARPDGGDARPPPETDEDGGEQPEENGRSIDLALRFVAVVLLVFLGSMAVAGTLNFLKFERIYLASAQQRYDPVLRDVVAVIGRSSGAGLDLASNFALQVAIDRAAALQDGAVDIHVTDRAGRLLFSSMEAEPPAALSAIAAGVAASGAPARHSLGDRFLTLAPIIDGGRGVGSVAIVFGAQAARSEIGDLRNRLVRVATLLSLIFVPLIVLVAAVTIVPLERHYARVTALLRRLGTGGALADGDAELAPILRHARRVETTLRENEV